MKYLRFSLLAAMALLWNMLLSAQTNVLSVDTVTTPSGKMVNLPIALNNTSDITGVQFDISVPYELAKDSLGNVDVTLSPSRLSRYTLETLPLGTEWKNYYPNGLKAGTASMNYHKYRIILYSARNELVGDDHGTLLSLQLTIPVGLNNGAVLPVYLSEVVLSDGQKNGVAATSTDGAIVVEEIPRPDLMPVDVSFTPTPVGPGQKFTVRWKVKNVGLAATEDGWSEQIMLKTVSGNQSRLISTLYYDQKLGVGSEVSRETDVMLPALLGVDGICKVEVEVVPTEKTGEHPTYFDNNTAQSTANVEVSRQLYLELSKIRLTEGGNQRITAKLSRSGRWNTLRVFDITGTADSRVSIPKTVTMPAGQSGVVFNIDVTDNDKVDADSVISISVKSEEYEAVTARLVIEDDEHPALGVTASQSVLTEGDTFTLTITAPRVSAEPVTVKITSEDNKRFQFNSSAEIPAGKTSTTVMVTCVDDNVPNLQQSNKFTVSSKYFNPGEVIVILNDNDMPVLSLTLSPDKVSESAGPTAVAAVLTRTGNTDSKITVRLSDDSNGGLYYSNKSVVMEKGVESIFFNLGPVDNTLQEGDRVYTLNAGIWVSSCNCAASGEAAGSVSAKLTVLDNDGAALAVSSQAGTVKEGGETTITVSRNTVADISKALTVTLSSNYDAELEYEKTVVIPSGQASVQMTVKSKKNDVPDDSHTVIFTVSAEGYASGTCMMLVTDQTLPDARAVDLKTPVSEAMIGTKFTANVTVVNDGAFPLAANTPVMFYQKGKADAIGTSYTEEEIPVGGTVVISRVITLPESVGDYTYYVVVNAQRSVTELVYTNNTSNEVTVKATSPFTAKVQTDKKVYRQGDVVRISGQLTGEKTVNETIDAYLINDNAREVKQVKTDGEGKFSLEWQLYDFQTGHFAMGACFKGDPTTEEMAAFDVYGLKRAETGYITCDVTCGESYTGVVSLVNAGKLPLTGVKAKVVDAPEGCEAQFSLPENIGSNETVSLSYILKGSKATQGKDWQLLKVQVTSAEGAFLEMTIHYYARTAQGNLVVEKQNLITTMNKDSGRDYSFFVTNNGKGNTGQISLSLPQWMTALTGATMPGLNQNDTATVVLRMTPTADMQLNVPVTGMFGINCENGNGTFVNFNITPVSDKTGTLVIDVTDEYTYYTDAKPHVKDAEIVLRNPVTGALVAQGKSNADGLYTIELPEGYYQVNVTADKHDSYKNNVLVDPGTTMTKVVCLSYQAISVTWGVEETEVEDEYNIVTTVKYETNVPAPVIEVAEPDNLEEVEQLGVGESLIYYAILTNKGLINANHVNYTIEEWLGGFRWEPLVECKGLTLAPQQSYTIPVKVTRQGHGSGSHRIGGNQSTTEWYYDPNTEEPVVEVTEPDDLNTGGLDIGGSITYEVTLTNKGKVKVRDVGYTIPITGDRCKWEPQSSSTSLTLEPGESVTITVKVTRIDSEEESRISGSHGGSKKPCGFTTMTDWDWECGPEGKYGWFPHKIKVWPCDDVVSNRGWYTVYGNGLGSPGGSSGGGSYQKQEQYQNVGIDIDCHDTACMLAIAQAAAECLLSFTDIGCIYGMGKAIYTEFNRNVLDGSPKEPKWYEYLGVVMTGAGCIIKNETVGKILNIAGCIMSFATLDDCKSKTTKTPNTSYRTRKAGSDELPDWVKSYQKSISPVVDYLDDYIKIYTEFFGSDIWLSKSSPAELGSLLEVVLKQGQKGRLDAKALIDYKPQDVTTEQFNTFIERINNTMEYESTGKVSVNMIHSDVMAQLSDDMHAIDESVAKDSKGKYADVGELFAGETAPFVEQLQGKSSSTCATISLQIDQTMTMTRQAFRGTLTMTNGNKDLPITDVKLKLNVTNLQTNLVATAKEFEMHTESLKDFVGDLDMESGWHLGSDSTGTATILFIPSKYAAPDEPVEYSFGGTLSYIDPGSGLEVTRDLYPVTLTVKPSPELDLTYFMQRDLYGDDALTEEIEPMVPGEFAVVINNKGNGDATNVRMVTKQPKIIENEKGLYIDFEFVSSQLNGQAKTLAMGETIPTDFGTIPAHSQAYAQWWLQSSLLGHFVDYDIQATHVTSYGNENLSLLDQVTIHELIHGFTPGVVTDGGTGTARGFLVNDISDFNDLPDHVHFTDATQQEVEIAADAVLQKQSNTEYILTITPSKAGWNYGSVLDPTSRRQLVKVVRQRDNAELPVDNVWKTDRTLVDGKDWRYERRLHYVVDVPESEFLNGEVLLLTFENRSEVELEVKNITGMEHPDYPVRKENVDQVNVQFNKAVKPETFTADDVKLTVQGETQNLESVKFDTKDNTNWTLDFSTLNKQLPNGYYVLTVQTSAITDYEGFTGYVGKKVDWVLFRGGLVRYETLVWPEMAGTVKREVLNVPAGVRMTDADQGDTANSEEYGTTIRLTAIPNDGYEFVNWTVGDAVVSTDAVYETKVIADTYITANYRSKQCRLTADTNGFGTLSGHGTGLYDVGTSLEIVAHPDEDYKLKNWLVDDKAVNTPSDTLRLTIEKPVTVTAVFERDVFLQTLTFERGWNWVSSFLREPQSLGDIARYANRVVSQQGDDVDALLPDMGYKVEAMTPFSVSMRGHASSDQAVIGLNKDWNWMAYPLSEDRPLGVIVNASKGDVITGQDGFSSFDDGTWEGTLVTLQPGNAYLYKSVDAKSLQFNSGVAAGSRAKQTGASSVQGVVDKRLYPNTMNVTARIYLDGQELPGGSYTIYAYVGNELRGISQYVGQNHYLTVYGDQPEETNFLVENNGTGETTAVKSALTFCSDVVGSRSQPYAVNIESSGINQIDYTSGPMTVYNLQGVLISRDATIKTLRKLPKGIYILNGKRYLIK